MGELLVIVWICGMILGYIANTRMSIEDRTWNWTNAFLMIFISIPFWPVFVIAYGIRSLTRPIVKRT